MLSLHCQLEQLLAAALGSCAAASWPLLAQLALQLALLLSATRVIGAFVAYHGLVWSAFGCAQPAGLEHPLAPPPSACSAFPCLELLHRGTCCTARNPLVAADAKGKAMACSYSCWLWLLSCLVLCNTGWLLLRQRTAAAVLLPPTACCNSCFYCCCCMLYWRRQWLLDLVLLLLPV